MKFTVKTESTLLDFLRQAFLGASNNKLRGWLKLGQVWVEGKVVARADHALHSGETVEVRHKAKKELIQASFPILYEDPAIMVVVKPTGLLSMSTEYQNTYSFIDEINRFLRMARVRERAYLVHRLDQDVSGIMVFAKSPVIKRALQNNWDQNDKRYYALVEGHPPKEADTIEGWLVESRDLRVSSCSRREDAKYAITHYRVLKRYPQNALLEVRLETGRRNQIRVHLADLGCPIVGDEKYGAKTNPLGRIGLHAYLLGIVHPTSQKRMQWEMEMPPEFQEFDRKQKSDSVG